MAWGNLYSEAERLKDINLMAYLHEYLGEPVGTGGEVFPNIEVRDISDDEYLTHAAHRTLIGKVANN